MLSQVTGIPTLYVRKAAKDYGTCRLAEGGAIDGRRLFIVEDVITSGGAVIDAVRELRNGGAIVKQGVCVIDRESGGLENLLAIDIAIAPLFTMTELNAAAAP